MKRSFLYLLGIVVVLTFLVMKGGGVVAGPIGDWYDNVTYTLPYLNTGTASNVYCIIANNTSDNATIQFRVSANSGTNLTSATVVINNNVSSSGATVYSRQSRMLSFEGTSVKVDGIAIGDISSYVTGGSYGGRVTLMKGSPGMAQGQLPGGQLMLHSGNRVMGTWACTDLPMACFQGTTNPKRNLVGYICSDLYTPATPAQHYTY
ncbi:hypothetical protein [Candidatus Magnetominusculus xianensis]|uniref:Secreted protein n=1 Tax=Candidatus Magnetominusculus xianensis TaxID=1748249 RepID=A0ABR5SH33_9BACT|nr:hypothetical protein [Candidatus Magnetominusculus xianensis]KWT90997.1 hypothetical protein ASN18_1081 [Candidatus Magnetominusculus xianensis]MBF0403151.1 hypothetical protein [Nitrospirota bacterium]